MEVLFWASLGLVLYVYVGYPALAFVMGKVFRRAVAKAPIEPTVTIVIAAYNEHRHIAATIENKLALDYPPDKLSIIVVSDESTDGTDDIVARYAREYPERVRLLRQTPRNGKTSALNLAMPLATGEIVVFSDANSLYDRGALRALVANFADPSVGYVTGRIEYANAGSSAIGGGSSKFMSYEHLLRLQETLIGSVVGVDGGIDAVRRSLYRPMRHDQLPDFVLPLRVVEQGYRVVYSPDALLVEEALTKDRDEFRMRVRVALRALWALFDMRALFNFGRFGMFSWQLLSHKALRYLAFIPLGLLFVATIVLVARRAGAIYDIALVGEMLGLALALVGLIRARRWAGRGGIATAAYYFVILNAACAYAFLKFLRRERQAIWQPRVG